MTAYFFSCEIRIVKAVYIHSAMQSVCVCVRERKREVYIFLALRAEFCCRDCHLAGHHHTSSS